MKKRVIIIISCLLLLAIISVPLVRGIMYKRLFDINAAEVTSIAMRSGGTGEIKQITDKAKIDAIVKDVNDFRYKDKKVLEDGEVLPAGWSYEVQFCNSSNESICGFVNSGDSISGVRGNADDQTNDNVIYYIPKNAKINTNYFSDMFENSDTTMSYDDYSKLLPSPAPTPISQYEVSDQPVDLVPDLDGFYTSDNIPFETLYFNMTRDDSTRVYEADGDLGGNGKVHISIARQAARSEYFTNPTGPITLTIGKTSVQLNNGDFDDACIVDMDESDNYKELIIETDNMGYIHWNVYRYINGTIYYLGDISNHSLFDKNGKIIDGDQIVRLTSPLIAMSYYIIVDNKFVLNTTNADYIYNKKYSFNDIWIGDYVNFMKVDKLPDNFEFNVYTDASKNAGPISEYKPKTNETFTLLKATPATDEIFRQYSSDNGDWYYVQLQNGNKGIIFFTVAN